jgi:hypothetical protein
MLKEKNTNRRLRRRLQHRRHRRRVPRTKPLKIWGKGRKCSNKMLLDDSKASKIIPSSGMSSASPTSSSSSSSPSFFLSSSSSISSSLSPSLPYTTTLLTPDGQQRSIIQFCALQAIRFRGRHPCQNPRPLCI